MNIKKNTKISNITIDIFVEKLNKKFSDNIGDESSRREFFKFLPILESFEKYYIPGELNLKSSKVVLKDHKYILRLPPISLQMACQMTNNTQYFDAMFNHIYGIMEQDYVNFFATVALNGYKQIEGLSKLTNVLETKAPDAITIDDLIELRNKRCTSNGYWLMHIETRKMIRHLKDVHFDRPLLQYYVGHNETLLGCPVVYSGYMPEPASGKIVIYFGDFSEVVCKTFILGCEAKYFTSENLYGIFPKLEFDAKLKDNDTKKIAALKFKS